MPVSMNPSAHAAAFKPSFGGKSESPDYLRGYREGKQEGYSIGFQSAQKVFGHAAASETKAGPGYFA